VLAAILVIGAEPLYNNSKIIPTKISNAPNTAQHKADAKRQSQNPATVKITANAAIIAQLYAGICEFAKADFILPVKSMAYAFSISILWLMVTVES